MPARGDMLLGAHLAGAAIENSMLGATHALANPLSARFDTTHGVAIGIMLPHVVRWNEAAVGELYRDLERDAGWGRTELAAGLTELVERRDSPCGSRRLAWTARRFPEWRRRGEAVDRHLQSEAVGRGRFREPLRSGVVKPRVCGLVTKESERRHRRELSATCVDGLPVEVCVMRRACMQPRSVTGR